jgi:hypothetical protein
VGKRSSGALAGDVDGEYEFRRAILRERGRRENREQAQAGRGRGLGRPFYRGWERDEGSAGVLYGQ